MKRPMLGHFGKQQKTHAKAHVKHQELAAVRASFAVSRCIYVYSISFQSWLTENLVVCPPVTSERLGFVWSHMRGCDKHASSAAVTLAADNQSSRHRKNVCIGRVIGWNCRMRSVIIFVDRYQAVTVASATLKLTAHVCCFAQCSCPDTSLYSSEICVCVQHRTL